MCRIFISGALYLGLLVNIAHGQNCAEDKVRKCISIAEPMLKDPHLIFPDNMNDINNVCRTWANFVDCIRRYIDKCFSKVRKEQFNSAVEPPIESVHQMCSVSTYQAEYLQYAGCIKSTVVEPEHCGSHYAMLVSEVSQENVRKANLCCAYHNFRSCVITKTRLRCDANQADGIAARFSRQVLDKAFRFLQDQCLNYVQDTNKCSAIMSSAAANTASISISRLGEGRSVNFDTPNRTNSRKTSFADVYRSSNKAANNDLYDTVTSGAQATSYDAARLPSSKFTTNLDSRTSISSQAAITSGPLASGNIQQQQQQQQQQARQVAKSSGKVNNDADKPDGQAGVGVGSNSRKTEAAHYTPIVENSGPIASATQRSLSFGRGISWSTPTTTLVTTTSTSTTTSEIPAWATNTWLTHSQDLTTEEIYPAAGSFGGNNIDEPNQQGLSRNAQTRLYSTAIIYLLVLCAVALVL